MNSTASSRSSPGLFSASYIIRTAALLVLVILVSLGVVALLNAFNFSIGKRTGVIGKLSTKGLACWTMEGQLAMPNFSQSGALRSGNGTVDNTFYFSVPDPEIRKQMQAIPSGSPVTLEYRQKLFALHWPVPFFCLRRTEYEITGVSLAPAFSPNGSIPSRP